MLNYSYCARALAAAAMMAMAINASADNRRGGGGGGGGGGGNRGGENRGGGGAVSRPEPARPSEPSRPAPVYRPPEPSRPSQPVYRPAPQPQPERPQPQPRPEPVRPQPQPQPIYRPQPQPQPERPAPQPPPNRPSQPNRPTQPNQPNRPTQPNQPNRPTQPNQPSQPSRPGRVIQPSRPLPPNQPVRPIGVQPHQAPHVNPQVDRPQSTVRYNRPSELQNRNTVTNIRNAENLRRGVSSDRRVVTVVNNHTTIFVNRYENEYREHYRVVNRYYYDRDYHYYYAHYYRWGFYGGYYYPVRPCYDIHMYFYYPVVFWLYVDDSDDYYYRTWYGNDYYIYPVNPFPYARVYYPTDTFRNIGIEVSAMPSRTQSMFRTAMIKLTESLAQQIADNSGQSVSLNENNIVVNHYENLQNQALVMEGFVDINDLGIHAAFKALLDLNNPENTLVYVPTSVDPTDADLYTLRVINDRIQQLGGNPYQAAVEPEQSSGGVDPATVSSVDPSLTPEMVQGTAQDMTQM